MKCQHWAALLWILWNIASGSCSQCLTALNDPSSSRPKNFTIPLNPEKMLANIFTFEASVNLGHARASGVPHKDLLMFIAENDTKDAPMLEIETQVNQKNQCMFIRGTIEGVSYPSIKDQKYVCGKDQDGYFKISHDNKVKFQIASIESVEGYNVSLSGFPGLNHLFNYGSSEDWQKFNDKRISSTRRIINACKQDCHLSYTKISVCSDPQPILLDKMAVQIVKAKLGRTYNLSCSASGAPFLGTEWRDLEDNILTGFSEFVSTDEDKFLIKSELVISDFHIENAGNYTCTIFNKNFGNRVKKVVSLQYLTFTAPNSTYSFADSGSTQLVWTVKGHPLLRVNLECNTELNLLVPFTRQEGPTELTLSIEFSKKYAPNILFCVLLSGTELLDKRTITKEEVDSKLITKIPEPPSEVALEDNGWDGFKIAQTVIIVLLVICLLIAIYKYCKLRNQATKGNHENKFPLPLRSVGALQEESAVLLIEEDERSSQDHFDDHSKILEENLTGDPDCHDNEHHHAENISPESVGHDDAINIKEKILVIDQDCINHQDINLLDHSDCYDLAKDQEKDMSCDSDRHENANNGGENLLDNCEGCDANHQEQDLLEENLLSNSDGDGYAIPQEKFLPKDFNSHDNATHGEEDLLTNVKDYCYTGGKESLLGSPVQVLQETDEVNLEIGDHDSATTTYSKPVSGHARSFSLSNRPNMGCRTRTISLPSSFGSIETNCQDNVGVGGDVSTYLLMCAVLLQIGNQLDQPSPTTNCQRSPVRAH